LLIRIALSDVCIIESMGSVFLQGTACLPIISWYGYFTENECVLLPFFLIFHPCFSLAVRGSISKYEEVYLGVQIIFDRKSSWQALSKVNNKNGWR
jgi:hypothetical protein